jgi:hypothetical protein
MILCVSPMPHPFQHQAWYTVLDRACTKAEVLVLALLAVDHDLSNSGDELVKWTQKVFVDGAFFVDGAAWKPPVEWRRSEQWVVALFNKFIGGKNGRVIAAAALEYDGTVLSANEIDHYLRLLRGDTLLGAGGGTSARKGAPLRRTYVQPLVARFVRANRSKLLASLGNAVAPPPSPSKGELKRALHETQLQCEKETRLKQISRDAEKRLRANMAVAVAARVENQVGSREKALGSRESALGSREKALADATETLRQQTAGALAAARRAVNAELDALREELSSETTRADTAEVAASAADRRVAKLSKADPAALRRLQKQRAELNHANFALRLELAKPSMASEARQVDSDAALYPRLLIFFVFFCVFCVVFLCFGEPRVLIFE